VAKTHFPHTESGRWVFAVFRVTPFAGCAGLLDFSFPMSLSDQLGFRFTPPERRVWTVRALVAAVRTHVEREYSDAWVEGEISNFRAPDSGHLYFTLKDGNAQIRVVMFASKARLLRFRPADGMQVVARGRVTIYEDRGELQIAAEYLEPKGAGGLQVAFEQLKAKLEAEGLFAAERKKAIPTLPARIGIVTSPQAAALRDILNILQRRHHSVNTVIYPAQVQGDSAAAEVASGVRYFNQTRSVEVIIVGRGGGSAEDLAAFNNEGLARGVAASEIPVISAVGHETDFTIVDFVADLRAPTPSAAAELVIRSRVEVENQAEAVRERLVRAMERRLLVARHALTERAQHGAFARMMDLIRQRQQKVDDLTFRLERGERQALEQMRRRLEMASAAVRHYDLRRVLAGVRGELEAGTAALASAMRNQLLLQKLRLERMGRALETLSPLAILERGYALVFDGAGGLVKDASQVKVGEEISARVARGEIRAVVKKATAAGDAARGIHEKP
jgi:exodeoxyribonuclease VII large subunit